MRILLILYDLGIFGQEIVSLFQKCKGDIKQMVKFLKSNLKSNRAR